MRFSGNKRWETHIRLWTWLHHVLDIKTALLMSCQQPGGIPVFFLYSGWSGTCLSALQVILSMSSCPDLDPVSALNVQHSSSLKRHHCKHRESQRLGFGSVRTQPTRPIRPTGKAAGKVLNWSESGSKDGHFKEISLLAPEELIQHDLEFVFCSFDLEK